ncbi:MAG: EamA family transporter [Clostridiaceae bacterium]|jgi:drug/metabolite transporter (DMT)-like permease|nr:EamA family transporter [Clostridiaceae bacterium]
MWLVFALLTTFSWAFADLFYKKGAVSDDKVSHIKTVIMVGLVMGIHGFGYMLVKGIAFSPVSLIVYFPVSFMYILSMTIGYLGLRYIELSISSPVQNSSGAVTAILLYVVFAHSLSYLEITAIITITLGIVALAAVEKHDKNRTLILSEKDKKYQKGFIALIFPILYCVIDGLGTFADAVYLDELSLIGEDEALLAYEFTFFICAIFAFIYLKVKKEQFVLRKEKDRGAAALFETVGQFFYVFAMSRNAIIVAPLIASYSVFSVLLSRIFLKEKLTKKQYWIIAVVMSGIIMLALSEVI